MSSSGRAPSRSWQKQSALGSLVKTKPSCKNHAMRCVRFATNHTHSMCVVPSIRRRRLPSIYFYELSCCLNLAACSPSKVCKLVHPPTWSMRWRLSRSEAAHTVIRSACPAYMPYNGRRCGRRSRGIMYDDGVLTITCASHTRSSTLGGLTSIHISPVGELCLVVDHLSTRQPCRRMAKCTNNTFAT